jgi:protein subunit release factor B
MLRRLVQNGVLPGVRGRPVQSVLQGVHHVRLLSDKKQRAEVLLQETDLRESFVKGSGKGGQKINKVRNCVLLTHVPTGLQVQCQKTRSLDGNRRAARKLLLQKLDDHINGALSKRSEKIDKLRRKKARNRAKAKQKYAQRGEKQEESAEEEDDDYDEEDEDEGSDDDEIDLEQHRFKAKKKSK